MTDLTPQPPSLKGKGETSSVLPSYFRGGTGGECFDSDLVLNHNLSSMSCRTISFFYDNDAPEFFNTVSKGAACENYGSLVFCGGVNQKSPKGWNYYRKKLCRVPKP
jgi:hypothetical protein